MSDHLTSCLTRIAIAMIAMLTITGSVSIYTKNQYDMMHLAFELARIGK